MSLPVPRLVLEMPADDPTLSSTMVIRLTEDKQDLLITSCDFFSRDYPCVLFLESGSIVMGWCQFRLDDGEGSWVQV
jgi:hypothetical protein